MLCAAVSVTMGGGLVICRPNTSSATSILVLLPTARALSSVGLLLVLSALVLLFAAIGSIPPVMADH